MGAATHAGLGLLAGLGDAMAEVGTARGDTERKKELIDMEAKSRAMHDEGLERLRASNNMALAKEEGSIRAKADLDQIGAKKTADIEVNAAAQEDKSAADLLLERERGANDVRTAEATRSASRTGMEKIDDQGYTVFEDKKKSGDGLNTYETTTRYRYKDNDYQKWEEGKGWVRIDRAATEAAQASAAEAEAAPKPEEEGLFTQAWKRVAGEDKKDTGFQGAAPAAPQSDTPAQSGTIPRDAAGAPTESKAFPTTRPEKPLTGPDAEAFVQDLALRKGKTVDEIRTILKQEKWIE